MGLNAIRVFAISKLTWIRGQQRKLRDQVRESPREYLTRESHYVWGRRYLLEIVEKDVAPKIELKPGKLVLQVRAGSDAAKRNAVLEDWYRGEVRDTAIRLAQKWEPILGVEIGKIFVQRMKTKWGGCNPDTRNIRLNTDLAKKPRESLEYILVHEMAHLIEPTHNDRFQALLDRFIPSWKSCRDELNRLPVRHEVW